MAKLLKLRRGTTSQHSSFTGAEGEVTVDTDKDTLVVHDGSTAGGTPLATEADLTAVNTDLSNDTTPQLGGNLDVNTKNIIFGDSSDGASDDVAKFGVGAGGVPDLSVYSNGSEGILGIPDGGTLKVKDGTNTLATFSGASNQVDFHNSVVFIGNSSNGTWSHTANKFVANVQGNLSGTADIATEVNVTANNSTDETVYPVFVDGTTGQQGIETDTGLAYNPSTGILSAGGLTLSGDLTVNGTTTTIATTNTTLEDNLLELNSGATSNANDAGILIERGSTGDNAIIAWDESADKFTLGTTTATASSTGDITITTGTLVADLNGTADVATTITTALEATDTSCNVVFTTAATGDLAPKTSTGLTYNSATGALAATSFSGDGSGLSNLPATSPAGSNNTIQFNNNGSFGGTGDIFRNNSNTGIYATGGFTDTIGNVRYVGSQYLYANNWVNSTSQVGRCLLAQGNFYLGSIATGAIVSVVNDTGSDITISRQTSYLYNTGTGDNNSSYTLTSRGMVTFWYAASGTVYMSGSGVS